MIRALALTLQGLAYGHREGWDDGETALRLFEAAGCALAFLAWEARHPFPAPNLRIFARPAFCIAALVIFATGVAVYGSTYLVPLFVQLAQHYPPASVWEILPPAGVMMFAASMWLLSDVAMFTSFEAMAFAVAPRRTGILTAMPAANASAMRQVQDMLAFAAPAATFLTQTGGALGSRSCRCCCRSARPSMPMRCNPSLTSRTVGRWRCWRCCGRGSRQAALRLRLRA